MIKGELNRKGLISNSYCRKQGPKSRGVGTALDSIWDDRRMGGRIRDGNFVECRREAG